MTHESEPSFLARRQRQRQQFKELAILDGGAADLLAIDKFRRERGDSTEVGDAIRSTYATIQQRAPEKKGLFNRLRGAVGEAGGAITDINIGDVGGVAGGLARGLGRNVVGGAEDFLTGLSRPVGAVIGGLAGETPIESAKGVVEGFRDPSDLPAQSEKIGFVRFFSDEDILGPVSPREAGGFIATIAFDPIDLIVGGSALIGSVKGGKALVRKFGKSLPSPTRPAVPRTPAQDIIDELLPSETLTPNGLGIGLSRRYEGAIKTQGLEIKRDLDLGNLALKELEIGTSFKGGRAVARSVDMEQLFKALHGEADVPAHLQPIFDELRRQVDLETVATVNFDPKFMAHPDYFPRGWIAPKETRPGAAAFAGTPGFVKPRIDATFTDMLKAGWEPRSWNPFEMVAERRLAGARFREQRTFLNYAKNKGVAAVVDGPMEEGWRIPRVGPAFEGTRVVLESGQTISPKAWAVPNKVADLLESEVGRGPTDPTLKAIGTVVQTTKRLKLLGSFFQQVDFATRTGFATFGGSLDALLAGHPVAAVQRLARLPANIGELAWANSSPARRKALRDQVLSGDSLIDGRAISIRGIAEQGARFGEDISILPRDINQTLRAIGSDVPAGTPLAVVRQAGDKIVAVERAMQNGLFDGVYVQAQITALKNFIVPRLTRQHPDWDDVRLMANAATEVNKMFSTLGDFQTIFKSQGWKNVVRNIFFSSNESESLIRATFSTVLGPNKALWGEFWVGGALFLAATAEAIHFAATGEGLPVGRFKLLEKGGPLGVRYNSDALSPQIPILKGRGGVNINLDLMGQMDTVLRMLNPRSFFEARESVPVRAIQNQLSGEDFFGRPLDTSGERIMQFASDVGVPIGAGNVLGAAGIGPENEGRLDVVGQAIQATGLNLRAETTPDLLERKAQEQFGKPFGELEPHERKILDEDEALKTELDQRRETSALRGSEGAERSLAAEEARQATQDEQLASDASLDDGQLSPDAWRSQRRLRLAELRGALGQIFGEGERATDTPSQQLAAKVEEFTDEQGQVDWDQVDAWLGGLPAEDREFITRNTGLSDTPKEAEYRKALSEADDFGYFTFDDQSWAAVKVQAPPEVLTAISRFDNFHEWRTASLNELIARLGLPEGIGRQQAVKILEAHPAMKAYRRGINVLQQDMIVRDADLAQRLTEWDLLTTTENERRFIAGALQ